MSHATAGFTPEHAHAVEIVCTTVDTSEHAFKVSDTIKTVLHNLTRDQVKLILDANPDFAKHHRATCVKESNSDRGYYDDDLNTLDRCKWLWAGAKNDKCILKKLKNRSYTTSARTKQERRQAVADNARHSEGLTNELSCVTTNNVAFHCAALAKWRYNSRSKFGLRELEPVPIMFATQSENGTIVTKLDVDGVKTTTTINSDYTVRAFDCHFIVATNNRVDCGADEANTVVFSAGTRGTAGTELFLNKRGNYTDVIVGGGFAYYLSTHNGIECSHILSYCQGERGRATTNMPMRSGLGTMLMTHDFNTLVYVCNMGVVLWVLCKFVEYRRVILLDNTQSAPANITKKYGKCRSFGKPVTMEEGLPWGNPIRTTAIPAVIMSGDPDTVVFQEGPCMFQMHVPFLGMGPFDGGDGTIGSKHLMFETTADNTLLSAGRNVVCTTLGIYTKMGTQAYTMVVQHECTSSSIFNNEWMLCDADWYLIGKDGVVAASVLGPPMIEVQHARKRAR